MKNNTIDPEYVISDEEKKHAVQIVQELIRRETERLEAITRDDEAPAIMVEGYTSEEFLVQGMVDSQNVANILLRYDYPVYHVLEYDLLQNIWDDLARYVGLKEVCSMDI